jgi:signal transduction histidine kinase
VTEWKQREEKFRRAQRREGSARLAGGVAHDFNNLLVVINGYAEMILAELKAEDPLRGEAQEIINAGNRAAALTRQLLAFCRKQVMRICVINLDELLTNLEKMFRRLIREDIELKRTVGAGLWSVKADPDRVEQVVMNLVLNARTLCRRRRADDGTSNIELGGTGGQRIPDMRPGTVRSDGTAGDRHDGGTKRRLFEPFSRQRSQEGTGLGLHGLRHCRQQR